MVHLDRIHEEIRVLNIKDETLLSFRVFENFNKRLDHFKTVKLGMFPDHLKLTGEEEEEKRYIVKYLAETPLASSKCLHIPRLCHIPNIDDCMIQQRPRLYHFP